MKINHNFLTLAWQRRATIFKGAHQCPEDFFRGKGHESFHLIEKLNHPCVDDALNFYYRLLSVMTHMEQSYKGWNIGSIIHINKDAVDPVCQSSLPWSSAHQAWLEVSHPSTLYPPNSDWPPPLSRLHSLLGSRGERVICGPVSWLSGDWLSGWVNAERSAAKLHKQRPIYPD